MATKTHIRKPGSEDVLCGEDSLFVFASELCGRCSRRVDLMFKLLADCRATLQEEHFAIAEPRHPRATALDALMKRIDRVLAGSGFASVDEVTP